MQLADAAKAGLWDKVNTNTEKFTSPTILGAINNYKKLIDDGYFNSDIKTATFVDQGNAMLNDKAAMVLQVNSYFGELQSLADWIAGSGAAPGRVHAGQPIDVALGRGAGRRSGG